MRKWTLLKSISIIFGTLLVSFLLFMFLGTYTEINAQTVIQESISADAEKLAKPKLRPNIYVEDLKLSKTDYRAGETVSGSFTLSNSRDFGVANIRYVVYLMGDYENTIPRARYDHSVMYGPFFLSGYEKKLINFTYKIPESINGTDLGIQVKAMLDNGFRMGWDDVMISVSNGIGMLEVVSSRLFVDPETFNLQAGPTINSDSGQKAILNITLKNNIEDKISITPFVSIYKKSNPDNILASFNDEPLSIDKGEEGKILIDLPTFNYDPQVYVGEISFLDDNNVKRAPTLEFRYIVGGDIVTINSITSDKSSVEKGEDFKVTIFYHGTPGDISRNEASGGGIADFNLKVFNQNNKLVVDYSDRTDLNKNSLKSINVKALESAKALRAEATFSKGGKVLTSYGPILSSDYAEKTGQIGIRDYFSLKAIIAFVAFLIFILMLVFIKKLIKNKVLFIILVIILIALVGIVLFINIAEAYTLTSYSHTGNIEYWFEHMDLFLNSPKEYSILTSGSTYNFTMAMETSCGNSWDNWYYELTAAGTTKSQTGTDVGSGILSVPFKVTTAPCVPYQIWFKAKGTVTERSMWSFTDTFTGWVYYDVNCPPPPAPVNGSCGTAVRNYAQGETFRGSYTYCARGTHSPSSIILGSAGGSTATWRCLGSNGGTNSGDCIARRAANGVCNTSATGYFPYGSVWSPSSYCAVGSPVYRNPNPLSLPPLIEGATATWQCSGINGGLDSGICRAVRNAPIPVDCGTATGNYDQGVAWPPAGSTYCLPVGTGIVGPPSGTKYYYRVRAINNIGTGNPSSPANATTP